MNLQSLFKFTRPVGRPTPSVALEPTRIVELSYYDIAKILKIAEHVAYCLSHLNREDLTFTAPTIGELNRVEIAECMRGFIGQKFETSRYNQDHRFVILNKNVDNIRTMLYDFEAWLTDQSKNLDSTGIVFLHVTNDFEHCRQIRLKLGRAVQ